MKLLILGGTRFLGRYLTEAALSAGHEVTLFNRGRSGPDLFPNVEQLHGDRDGGLAVLKGRSWDAVVDTCGYVPRLVSDSARQLATQAAHYTFISSLSVYADDRLIGMDESARVGVLEDPSAEEITGKTYGPLKALCEQAAEAAMPGRTLSVRAGLIVGPHDLSDRYTYWVDRIARGGEVLAPAGPDYRIQYIDVRDLAEWCLRMAEDRVSGVMNATGPAQPHTLGELLAACRTVSGSDATITWVNEAFLLEQKVGPWMEMPLWVPTSSAPGFHRYNIDRALAHGLTFRPAAVTAGDTLAWSRTRPADAERRAGMKPEREAELLAAWHAEAHEEG